ncbi:MAG: beta-propeller fold lactonase family protein [Terriglobales bacterium]
MSFLRAAARAALLDRQPVRKKSLGRPCLLGGGFGVLVIAVLGASLVSCAGSKSVPTFGQHQDAYVTLPGQNSVLYMQINSITGEITSIGQTPQVLGTSPQGLALLGKFLYVANSLANTVSLFNIAEDGSLSQKAAPTPAGSSPHAAVVDPSGQYLLVTNSGSGNYGTVSVFSIDSGSGALTEVAGSPFYSNPDPSDLVFAPTGDLVYVSNPGVGTVTAFTFSTSTGALTPVPGSPYYSGTGASGMAIDSTGTHLYVANSSAINNPPTSVGNLSGFNINLTQGPTYGSLSPITGSPFTQIGGNGPTVLVLSSNGILFATTSGSNYSVWAFSISSSTGALSPTINSPFSVASGNLFALIDPLGGFFYIGSPTGIQGYTYDQNNGQPTVITNSPFSTNGTTPGKMVISP